MLNSSEMDTFLAGLSEDCFECYPKSVLEVHIRGQHAMGESLEEIHTKLEGYFVTTRVQKGLPGKDPKPYSGETKKTRMVVYNRWTEEEREKYVLSKTASQQSKSEELWMDTLYSEAQSQKTSSQELHKAMIKSLFGSTQTS